MEREENQKEYLLIQNSRQEEIIIVDVNQSVSRSAVERTEIVEEVKKLVWLSGPLIFVSLLNYGLQVISIMFVGHLGELPLSGASLATSFATATGFNLMSGMASALDTLCGQSYGAKQYRLLGIQMQRAMFILMIVCIPLTIILSNTRSILIFLGQDHEISTEAGNYAKLMVPSLFAYGLLQCLTRFLQTQNIVFPMMFFYVVTTLLHILLCWIMVLKSGLGSSGAALANSITYWMNVIILSLYIKFSPSCKETWIGFSKEALHNIPMFLRLAIPSAVMVCLEMWSFESMVLLAGLLPNPKLETSVLSICLNTAALVWMIPFGLSGAVSIRVSNELGAGHPQTARLAVCVVVVIGIIESILVGMLMILIRNIWGYAYSNEVEVAKYVATMMPILVASNFLDGLQCVLSGNARGCGWQKIGAFVNLGSYYLVGIPSSLVLAFVLHIGGKGLWLGILCALIVQVLSLMIITICTNWEKEANKATERVYNSKTPETESLESWAFELLVIVSGALPNPKLQTSALSICFNTAGLFWMIPFGVSAAASTRISNALGAGCPKDAYLAVKVTLFMAVIIGILEFSLLIVTQKIWGHIFTNVAEVISYVATKAPILASCAFAASIQTAFSGIARGCGWQKIGAFVNLGSYYFVGVPIAIVLAFVLHMKGEGLFLGIVLALIMQVICFLIVTLRTNWEKEAKNAAIRVGDDAQALSSDKNETH